MADGYTPGTNSEMGTVNSLGCKDVTVGISDVKASTFNQESVGNDSWKDGYPSDLSDPSLRKKAQGIVIDSSCSVYRSAVIPYAFYVNASPGGEAPLVNISRMEAITLFSGQVRDWNQLIPDLDSDGTPNEAANLVDGGDKLPLVLCLRHAGSGAHAALDASVIRSDSSLLTSQAFPGDYSWYDYASQTETYFNETSKDVVSCVGNHFGAIGYAESDVIEELTELNSYTVIGNPEYGDVRKIAYNGYHAERDMIQNGRYSFWSALYMYVSSSEPGPIQDLVEDLSVFANDPATISTIGLDSWWVGRSEMDVFRATDFDMPVRLN